MQRATSVEQMITQQTSTESLLLETLGVANR
jgi:hypothetical protein